LYNTSPSRYLQLVPSIHSGTMIFSPLLLPVCFYLTTTFFCSFLRVGSAISWDDNFNIQTKGDVFSPVLDLALNCICFIYIGAWLPFDQFDISELGISPWRLVLLVLVILALRRIPCLLILYKWLPEVSSWREALFCGHFGPVSPLRNRSCLAFV
jgi:NhaP-type Na+/H+ or K+/H+ antiporter